jgi:hypothetical protein
MKYAVMSIIEMNWLKEIKKLSGLYTVTIY